METIDLSTKQYKAEGCSTLQYNITVYTAVYTTVYIT